MKAFNHFFFCVTFCWSAQRDLGFSKPTVDGSHLYVQLCYTPLRYLSGQYTTELSSSLPRCQITDVRFKNIFRHSNRSAFRIEYGYFEHFLVVPWICPSYGVFMFVTVTCIIIIIFKRRCSMIIIDHRPVHVVSHGFYVVCTRRAKEG